MDKIDSAVHAALGNDAQEPVPVLISCRIDCSAVKTRLQTAGVQVTAALNELNSLTADIVSGDIDVLSSDPDIQRVELDEIATTQ